VVAALFDLFNVLVIAYSLYYSFAVVSLVVVLLRRAARPAQP